MAYSDRTHPLDAGRAQRRHPTLPHRCAGCDARGRISLADPSPDDPRPVLRLAWQSDKPPRLQCARCRAPEERV